MYSRLSKNTLVYCVFKIVIIMIIMYSLFLFLSVESKSKVLHLTIVSTHQIQEIFNLPDKNKSFNVWDMIFWTMLSKVTMPAFLLMDKQVSNKESDMKKKSYSLEKSSNRPYAYICTY